MTAARPGAAFNLDLDGTLISGRYVEVDPPHRLVIDWDRQVADEAASTPTPIEITFTPTGDGTAMTVQFPGQSAEDVAFYRELWRRYLDRIAAAFDGSEPSASRGT